MNGELLVRRINPDGGRFSRRLGRLVDEAVWISVEGLVEDFLTGGMYFVCLPIMDLIRRHEADAEMMVVLVIPIEEGAAEGFGVLDAAEPFGELGLILEGLEAAF